MSEQGFSGEIGASGQGAQAQPQYIVQPVQAGQPLQTGQQPAQAAQHSQVQPQQGMQIPQMQPQLQQLTQIPQMQPQQPAQAAQQPQQAMQQPQQAMQQPQPQPLSAVQIQPMAAVQPQPLSAVQAQPMVQAPVQPTAYAQPQAQQQPQQPQPQPQPQPQLQQEPRKEPQLQPQAQPQPQLQRQAPARHDVLVDARTNCLYTYDAQRGQSAWITDPATGRPMTSQQLFVDAESGRIFTMDAATGAPAWLADPFNGQPMTRGGVAANAAGEPDAPGSSFAAGTASQPIALGADGVSGAADSAGQPIALGADNAGAGESAGQPIALGNTGAGESAGQPIALGATGVIDASGASSAASPAAEPIAFGVPEATVALATGDGVSMASEAGQPIALGAAGPADAPAAAGEGAPEPPGSPVSGYDADASAQGKLPLSKLAVASLVLGIVALAIAWIPFVNIAAPFLAVPGLIFAIVGLTGVIANRKKRGRGLAVAGIVVSLLSIPAFLLSYFVLGVGLTAAVEDGALEELAAPAQSESLGSESAGSPDSADALSQAADAAEEQLESAAAQAASEAAEEEEVQGAGDEEIGPIEADPNAPALITETKDANVYEEIVTASGLSIMVDEYGSAADLGTEGVQAAEGAAAVALVTYSNTSSGDVALGTLQWRGIDAAGNEVAPIEPGELFYDPGFKTIGADEDSFSELYFATPIVKLACSDKNSPSGTFTWDLSDALEADGDEADADEDEADEDADDEEAEEAPSAPQASSASSASSGDGGWETI